MAAGNGTTVYPKLDDIVVGSTYLLMSLAAIIAYVPCMIVMRRDKELKEHSCIRMMFHLGISDLVNLTDQSIVGYLTLTGLSRRVPIWFLRLFGGIHSAFTWYPYTTLCNIIALNRFLTICLPGSWVRERFFSDRSTSMWLVLCWLYALAWWVVYLSPYGGFIFFVDTYAFYFDPAQPWFLILKDIAWYQTIFNFICTVFWYLLIVVYLRKLGSEMISNQNQSSMQKKERTILVQASIICLYTIVCDQYWHLQPVLHQKYKMSYTFAFGNLLWISESALNPAVYYTFNKTIRKKVRLMFLGRNAVHPTAQNTRRNTHGNNTRV